MDKLILCCKDSLVAEGMETTIRPGLCLLKRINILTVRCTESHVLRLLFAVLDPQVVSVTSINKSDHLLICFNLFSSYFFFLVAKEFGLVFVIFLIITLVLPVSLTGDMKCLH